MYCQKCGKEIDDEAVVCIHCGCATKNQTVRSEDSDVRTSGAFIFLSVVFPIIGIIMGVIYMQSHNETRYHAGKTYLTAALVAIILVAIIYLFAGISVLA